MLFHITDAKCSRAPPHWLVAHISLLIRKGSIGFLRLDTYNLCVLTPAENKNIFTVHWNCFGYI